MTIYLKKDTAAQRVPLGQFLSSTDGTTIKTALTIASTDVYILKRGSTAMANPTSTNNMEHIGNGVYTFTADGTDTNTYGQFMVYCTPTGALSARQECCVVPALVYDSIHAGTDNLQVDMIQLSGTTQAARDIGTSVLVGDKTGFALTTAQADLIGLRVWNESTKALTDKVAFALTTGEHDLIGLRVWNESTKALTDKVAFALTTAQHDLIGARAWTETARTITEKTGFALTTAQHTAIGTETWAITTRALTDKINFALTSDYDSAKTAATLVQMEASTVLAKEDSVGNVKRLIAGYTIGSPTFSATNKMTGGIISTTTGGAYTVTVTYSTLDNLATYAVTS